MSKLTEQLDQAKKNVNRITTFTPMNAGYRDKACICLKFAKTEAEKLEGENERLKEIQYQLGCDKGRLQKEVRRLEEKIEGYNGALLEPLEERYKLVCEENVRLSALQPKESKE